MKAALRKEMAARRSAAANPAAQAAAQDHLRAALAGQVGAVLSGYMAMRDEIDPLPVMADHHAEGGIVGVPVILARATPLAFHRWTPTAPMIPGAFGALVPEDGTVIVPRILIVPLLAFDTRGFRLGYGGGFYDRTLAGLRAAGPVMAIGFAYGAQQVEVVPTEVTDERLDLIVTEAGILRPQG